MTVAKSRRDFWSREETFAELIERCGALVERRTESAEQRTARTRRDIPLFELPSAALEGDHDTAVCTHGAL